jgi:putative transcriptional regulator
MTSAAARHKMMAQDVERQLVAGYTAGVLDGGLALMVETLACLRPDVAGDISIADILGGELLQREVPVALGDDALDRVFALIDGLKPVSSQRERAAANAAASGLADLMLLPEPVRVAAFRSLETSNWKFAGIGLTSLELDLGGESKTEILRIEPGSGAPRHTHTGSEYTLVMTGAFTDETGHYGVGDIAVAGPGVTHQPVAERGSVCYALAVSEASLELTGTLGLLQRFLRH